MNVRERENGRVVCKRKKLFVYDMFFFCTEYLFAHPRFITIILSFDEIWRSVVMSIFCFRFVDVTKTKDCYQCDLEG